MARTRTAVHAPSAPVYSEPVTKVMTAVATYLDGDDEKLTRLRLWLRSWKPLRPHLSAAPGHHGVPETEVLSPALSAAFLALKANYYAGNVRIADELLTALRPVFGDSAVRKPARGWV